MKTTLEIPDELFRRAKIAAVTKGQSFKAYVAEALEASLSIGMQEAPVLGRLKEDSPVYGAAEPSWMKGFGRMKHLREESKRIEQLIEEEFETIEPDE